MWHVQLEHAYYITSFGLLDNDPGRTENKGTVDTSFEPKDSIIWSNNKINTLTDDTRDLLFLNNQWEAGVEN